MSGGHFDYKQYYINEISDSIDSLIRNNGKPKNKKDLDSWDIENGYLNHYKYPKEVINEFKKGLKFLKIAHIYAQRIDWLLSGDDGEKSFLLRLEEDLDKIK